MKNVLRWIAFLPMALILIAIAQTITGTIANWSLFIAFPTVLFLGGLVAITGGGSTVIAPNRKIGATVIIIVFVLLEIAALFTRLATLSLSQGVIRFYTDIAVIAGCVSAALNDPASRPTKT